MQTVNTKEYLDMACALLAEGQTGVPVPVAGTSMTPFLRPGDTVYLELPRENLRRGDVVLFVRPGGRYILHRIVGIRGGGFTIVGDSQTVREPVGRDQIRAVVTRAVCRGRPCGPGSLRWRFFATLWRWALPIRRPLQRLWEKFKKFTR